MGVGIYLKKNLDKQGRSLLFVRATYRSNPPLTKSISIKVLPKDWNSRTSRIDGRVENSIILNREIEKVETNLKTAWSYLEAGSYSWNEFTAAVRGGETGSQKTLLTFVDTVIKQRHFNISSFNTYLGVCKALLKEVEKKDIFLKELTNELIDSCVFRWKQRLSPSSVRTYILHLKKIKDLAYDKGLITEPFKRRDEWKVKKNSSIKIIETVKTEDFKEAIERIEDIYDLQAMYFYLLMFCLRGFYQGDIVTMHLHASNLVDADRDGTLHLDKKEKKYIKHQRSKTGELMEVRMDLEPIFSLIYTLRDTVRFTHGQRINKKTGEPFKKGKDVYSNDELKGWIFSYDLNDTKTHKNVWDVYQKRIKELLGKPFKTARKTFESYALKLKVSQDIRFKLLGHANPTIKAHYQDWEWEELKEQVDEAHLEVLEEYKAKELLKALNSKAKSLKI